MAKNRKPQAEVFLNVPYDQKFENLFLAYVAGMSAFGLVPRATLEIPTSSRRLERLELPDSICPSNSVSLSRIG